MKCAICSQKTDWDSSYGYEEFIVCPACFKRLISKYTPEDTMTFIFTCGQIRRDTKRVSIKNSWPANWPYEN